MQNMLFDEDCFVSSVKKNKGNLHTL